MTSVTFHSFVYTDRHIMKLIKLFCWLATLSYLNTCDGRFHLSHHVILADVLRHMSTASLSRNPSASSDCRNTILQFFLPCQNKFTNKHGRYIIKLSLCTIDGQKTIFVSFCLFSQFWFRGVLSVDGENVISWRLS